MSDQNTGPLDISLNLSETKTAVPMVRDGEFAKWRLVNLGMQKTDKGPMIKLEYDLVDPVANSDGGTLKPGEMGAKFFENIALFDKNTTPPDVPKWAQERIAKRIDALLGTGDVGNTKNKPVRPNLDANTVPQLIGKVLVAKMKVKTGDYVGNEFGNVVFPGDIAA